MSVISAAASAVACSTVLLPDRMACSIAPIVFLASTLPQAGVTGTLSPASFIWAANGETSGSSAAVAFSSSDSIPGKKLDWLAQSAALASLVISSTNFQDRSFSSEFSKTARCEPPTKDRDSPPSGPGMPNAPILPSSWGAFCRIDFGVQLPEIIMATVPLTNSSRRLVSFQVVAAGVDRPCLRARSV